MIFVTESFRNALAGASRNLQTVNCQSPRHISRMGLNPKRF